MTAHAQPRVAGRRLEVLELIAEGLSDQEIANKLQVTVPTVRTHLNLARWELGARNRTHLVARGYQTGLLTINATEVNR